MAATLEPTHFIDVVEIKCEELHHQDSRQDPLSAMVINRGTNNREHCRFTTKLEKIPECKMKPELNYSSDDSSETEEFVVYPSINQDLSLSTGIANAIRSLKDKLNGFKEQKAHEIDNEGSVCNGKKIRVNSLSSAAEAHIVQPAPTIDSMNQSTAGKVYHTQSIVIKKICGNYFPDRNISFESKDSTGIKSAMEPPAKPFRNKTEAGREVLMKLPRERPSSDSFNIHCANLNNQAVISQRNLMCSPSLSNGPKPILRTASGPANHNLDPEIANVDSFIDKQKNKDNRNGPNFVTNQMSYLRNNLNQNHNFQSHMLNRWGPEHGSKLTSSNSVQVNAAGALNYKNISDSNSQTEYSSKLYYASSIQSGIEPNRQTEERYLHQYSANNTDHEMLRSYNDASSKLLQAHPVTSCDKINAIEKRHLKRAFNHFSFTSEACQDKTNECTDNNLKTTILIHNDLAKPYNKNRNGCNVASQANNIVTSMPLDNAIFCNICSFETHIFKNWYNHYKYCHKTNPRMCPFCGYCRSQYSYLEIHIMTVHLRQKPFNCPYCPFSTGWKNYMKIHLSKHTNNNPNNLRP